MRFTEIAKMQSLYKVCSINAKIIDDADCDYYTQAYHEVIKNFQNSAIFREKSWVWRKLNWQTLLLSNFKGITVEFFSRTDNDRTLMWILLYAHQLQQFFRENKKKI